MKVPTADVTAELLRKYDRPGPRYTSYPTAVEFHEDFGATEVDERLAEANHAAGEPLSLYVHVPFCEARCAFCGCNVIITRREDVPPRYLSAVRRELDLLAERLPARRGVGQYHWGGGTPTHLTPDEMRLLHGAVAERFDIDPDGEIAIEVDPRVTTFEQLDCLRELGFNRLSMGVQDFAADVQAAITRNQTEEQTRTLFARCREMGFDSINVDLVYGLPRQTLEGFRRSLESVVEMRPERVAVYSYAHVPWIRSNQKRIETSDLPDGDTKLRLFGLAMEVFLGAGYAQIGMDHFAVPEDELARAAEKGTLHRNFMGYTVRAGSDMIGVGVSSISDVRGAFAQNTKKLTAYERALDEGRLPVEKGYRLDADDELRRHVITRIMCNFALDVRDTERRFGIDFAARFAPELERLGDAEAEGFLVRTPDRIEVTPLGRLFVRNVAMVFDRYLREKRGDRPMFSRTV